MRQVLTDVTAQLKAIWSRLEAPQRLVVSAVLLATVVGFGVVVWYAGQPSYGVVYRATSGEELVRAEKALTSVGITPRAGRDGLSLEVERADASEAMAAIAKAGLKGEQVPGLDIGGSMMEDANTRQWRLDKVSRAQAKLAIEKLEGVLDADVSASRPRRMMAFRNRANQERPTGAVVLRLRVGASFEDCARAASSIVASQLLIPRENIEVVSSSGGQRWRYDPDREAGGNANEFRKEERRLSDERTMMAQEALDRIWPGKTEVRITVELDPSWEIRSERVVPDEALVASEDVTKDSSDLPASSPEAGVGKSKNEQRNRKFVTDIGERRVGKMAPEVQRVSVALLYDAELEAVNGFDKQNLVDVVKAIAGWDDQRDTMFSTLSGPFEALPELEPIDDGPGIADVALQWAPMVGQVLGVLVVVMFLRGLFKRSGARAPVEAVGTMPQELAEEELSPEEQQKRMRREIERSIATDPAALAKMLEAWLLEQKA